MFTFRTERSGHLRPIADIEHAQQPGSHAGVHDNLVSVILTVLSGQVTSERVLSETYFSWGDLMIRGSCLCGGVTYQVNGPLSLPLYCHCRMCRKAHGTAFRSRAGVKMTDFHWMTGEALITWYESSPGTERGFCSRCGSPLLSRFSFDSDFYGLPLGALDDDPGIRPGLHVYVRDKAPWFEITDDLPQHDQGFDQNAG